MKKIIFGLTVAAVALLSACETLAPQEGAAQSGSVSGTTSDKVTLTATLGADTKVFLEQTEDYVFKTRWEAGDDFIVYDRSVDYSVVYLEDHGGYFELSEGAGESTAEFVLEEGYLPESYVAVFGNTWVNPQTEGKILMYHSRYQGREMHVNKDGETIQGFYGYEFPMVAEGTGNTLSFKNLASVLKLNVTGNGETLKSVTVTSLDEGVYLSGIAVLDLGTSSRPVLNFLTEDMPEYETEVFDHIRFDPSYEDSDYNDHEAVLSSYDATECYIILPAQTYPSGLKLTLETEGGMMEVYTDENLVFSQSELRELDIVYESNVDFDGRWRIESDESPEVVFFEDMEGDYYVIRNYFIDRYAYLNLYFGDQEYGWSSEYDRYTYQLTNTCGQLEMDGRYMAICHEGYYDLYFNPNTLQIFIMSAGVAPGELPTTENVACQNYYYLYNTVEDNTVVKVWGVVTAVYAKGYILYLNDRDAILVYTSTAPGVDVGDAVELYAKKTTWNSLPELTTITWSRVYPDFTGFSYSAYDITSFIDDYSSDNYDHIRITGTLTVSGSYVNIVVDGATRQGSIQSPNFNVSEYEGKKVTVEGFFTGIPTNNSYVTMVCTSIKVPDTGGSTEDVIPDDDIIIQTR